MGFKLERFVTDIVFNRPDGSSELNEILESHLLKRNDASVPVHLKGKFMLGLVQPVEEELNSLRERGINVHVEQLARLINVFGTREAGKLGYREKRYLYSLENLYPFLQKIREGSGGTPSHRPRPGRREPSDRQVRATLASLGGFDQLAIVREEAVVRAVEVLRRLGQPEAARLLERAAGANRVRAPPVVGAFENVYGVNYFQGDVSADNIRILITEDIADPTHPARPESERGEWFRENLPTLVHEAVEAYRRLQGDAIEDAHAKAQETENLASAHATNFNRRFSSPVKFSRATGSLRKDSCRGTSSSIGTKKTSLRKLFIIIAFLSSLLYFPNFAKAAQFSRQINPQTKNTETVAMVEKGDTPWGIAGVAYRDVEGIETSKYAAHSQWPRIFNEPNNRFLKDRPNQLGPQYPGTKQIVIIKPEDVLKIPGPISPQLRDQLILEKPSVEIPQPTITETQEQVKKLQSEIQNLQQQRDPLQQELAKLKGEKQELMPQVEELRKEKQGLEEQKAKLITEIDSLKAEIERVRPQQPSFWQKVPWHVKLFGGLLGLGIIIWLISSYRRRGTNISQLTKREKDIQRREEAVAKREKELSEETKADKEEIERLRK